MPISNVGAWRAFSLLKQADISTAAAVATRVPYTGDPIEPEPEQLYVNTDEVSGDLVPNAHRLLTMKLAGKHKSKAFPHLVGLFASMAMGKDTSTIVGAGTAYRHKIEADKTVRELPYRTMIEADGAVQRKYKGIACAGFTLSGDRGQFVELEADLIGAGNEATDATAAPIRVAESYLSYADVGFSIGGAFAGDAVTGGTDLKASLQSFSVNFKNNAKGLYIMGDASGGYGRVQRGEKFDIEIKAKLELEDTTHRAALLAGTEAVMHFPLIGGVADGTAHYEVEIVLPKVIYKGVKKGVADGMLVVDAEFQVLADGTNPPMIVYVTNLQAASYLATA
jgi:hypothetical protein